MSGKIFRFHPEAREEFRESVRWYRLRSIPASVEFRVGVSEAVREVARSPETWPKYLYGTRRFVLHCFPFSIVYLDDPEAVTIIAVAHTKRKPGYWKGRV
jgi:toxin ParE1/3/4